MAGSLKFAGMGSKDIGSKMPKFPSAPSTSGKGPVDMVGDGDKDTNGTFNTKKDGALPSGAPISLVGDGNKDLK